jgi:hypothetical protein
MQCYQPYDCSWNVQNELYDKWISYSTNVFRNMICCTICGLTKLNINVNISKKLIICIIIEIPMNLDVHFMILLVAYYLIIQLLQMKRKYIYV